VVVVPRSFGTDVQPGQERKFLDYAYPPLYPYNVVTNIGGRVGWQPVREKCRRGDTIAIQVAGAPASAQASVSEIGRLCDFTK
jgi:hypothetical protein